MDEQYIECQDCGDRISKPLSPAEIQKLANNPENYIDWCKDCKKDRDKMELSNYFFHI